MLKIARFIWDALSDFDALLSIGKWGVWKVVGAFMTGALTILLSYIAYVEDLPISVIAGGGFVIFVTAIAFFFLIIPKFFLWTKQKLNGFEDKCLSRNRIIAALEIICPKDVSIKWNPIFGSVLTIRENNSQKPESFDWKFTLKNIKKEPVRYLSLKWTIDVKIENLILEVNNFLQDLSLKVVRSKTGNDLQFSISNSHLTTIQKRKDGTNTTNYLLSSKEDDHLNSIFERNGAELCFPKGIINTITFYTLVMSQKIDTKHEFLVLPLPNIKLEISYLLESDNKTRITQTFCINARFISSGANSVGLSDLAITFDPVDYNKQQIDIKKL